MKTCILFQLLQWEFLLLFSHKCDWKLNFTESWDLPRPFLKVSMTASSPPRDYMIHEVIWSVIRLFKWEHTDDVPVYSATLFTPTQTRLTVWKWKLHVFTPVQRHRGQKCLLRWRRIECDWHNPDHIIQEHSLHIWWFFCAKVRNCHILEPGPLNIWCFCRKNYINWQQLNAYYYNNIWQINSFCFSRNGSNDTCCMYVTVVVWSWGGGSHYDLEENLFGHLNASCLHINIYNPPPGKPQLTRHFYCSQFLKGTKTNHTYSACRLNLGHILGDLHIKTETIIGRIARTHTHKKWLYVFNMQLWSLAK